MSSRSVPQRVAIAAAHRVYAETLGAWLRRNCPNVRIRSTLTDWQELIRSSDLLGSVLLLDDDLGGETTVSARVSLLRAQRVDVILMTTADHVADICGARDAGVRVFVNKMDSVSRVPAALKAVAESRDHVPASLADAFLAQGPVDTTVTDRGLSERELMVMMLYGGGLPLKSVARRLGVQEATIRTYLKRIKAKYAAHGVILQTKVDLLRQAVADGIVEIDSPPG